MINRPFQTTLAPVKYKINLAQATILIVEDDEFLCQAFEIILRSEGFRTRIAGHGLQALDILQSDPPDLILSDMHMPHMDGISLLNAVRSNPEWVTIPFILCTTDEARESILAGKMLGADDYLIKPVQRRELVETLRSRLARSRELLMVQLDHSYQLSLSMLANAIEQRDAYTRGHIERVTAYAICIALEMRLSAPQISALQFGSILHDIGKIHIREDILQKNGPLDTDEWSEICRHPQVGAEMVRNIPYLAAARPIIRHHHERWDGLGYPDELIGEQIPLGAQIVAVADALDVMTIGRSYQEPWEPERARVEILDGRGSRYSPSVVSAFEAAWPEILKIIDFQQVPQFTRVTQSLAAD